MEEEPMPLGTAPRLAPHGPADILDHFLTRYDYDYSRNPGDESDDSDGDGISGAVRNRPIFFHNARGTMDGDTTYRVDYVPPGCTADMRRLVEAAYGSPAMGEGVYVRQRFTLPGKARMAADDISIYKTDYTLRADDCSAAAATTPAGLVDGAKRVYAGAAAVPYKADFLYLKGSVVEDDGADVAPKITSDASRLPRCRTGPLEGAEGETLRRPSAAAAARYIMSSANSPWVPGRAAIISPVAASPPRAGGGGRTGDTHPCASQCYGDRSLAHPSQLPQDFAGSMHEDLLRSATRRSSTRLGESSEEASESGGPAALLRTLAGQTHRKDRERRPLAIFGGGGGDKEDETNPVFMTPAEQRKCASRRRLENEGHVKGVSMGRSDFVDQTRLPELPGNPSGPANPRETNTNARCTPGEMGAGSLTANLRAVSAMRSTHGTMLPNKRIAERTASMAGTSSRALSTVAAALPPPAVASKLRQMERREAVDKVDPHRHKLR